MFKKFSTERPYLFCRLAARMYQLRNTFLGVRLSRVADDTVFTLLVKVAQLRETRKTQSCVNDGYAYTYIAIYERKTNHEGIHV